MLVDQRFLDILGARALRTLRPARMRMPIDSAYPARVAMMSDQHRVALRIAGIAGRAGNSDRLLPRPEAVLRPGRAERQRRRGARAPDSRQRIKRSLDAILEGVGIGASSETAADPSRP